MPEHLAEMVVTERFSAALMTALATLARAMALVIAGLLAGGVMARVLSTFLAGQLYGITPGDPVTFVGVACVLAIVSALACWMPAHRAMRVDPLVALRAD